MTLRTPFIFLFGLVVGLSWRTAVAQDRPLAGNNGINHLAFATPQYAEMMQFYTQTLGFPVTLHFFRLLDPAEFAPGGKTRLVRRHLTPAKVLFEDR